MAFVTPPRPPCEEWPHTIHRRWVDQHARRDRQAVCDAAYGLANWWRFRIAIRQENDARRRARQRSGR